MGVSNSRASSRMSGSDQGGDGSDPQRILQPAGDGSEDDADLPSIVAYLIRSGQIRFISQDDADTDSDSDEGFMAPPCRPPPQENPNPDVKTIRKSDIYASIMQSSGRWSDNRWLAKCRPTLPNMIAMRDIGMKKQQQFTHGDKCIIHSRFLPNRKEKLASYHQKAFCGIYSEDGDIFLSACQDQNLRVYDTANDKFQLMKTIRARDVGWSVLDVAFSPDGRYAAYSSWSDCVHLCSIRADHDVHEALHFDPGDHSFCIFSLMFSSDNQEILGGANDGHIYVYDRETNKRTLKIDAHDDDVNTVRFADSSSQILYSGGDDGLCKVWDRRMLKEKSPEPVGTMAGHFDGITYIDSKGDARFFISNSKDQSLKLWDVRRFSDQAGIEETKKMVSTQRWDYRWQQVPKRMSKKRELKGDTSVMTYQGHCILHTLIRCKFSPEASTGQRYIYTGCATGSVVIYDVLTGKLISKLDGHKNCVRDVSWHPYKNTIISTSWDGTLGHWYYFDHNAHSTEPGEEVTVSCKENPRQTRTKRLRTREVSFRGLFD